MHFRKQNIYLIAAVLFITASLFAQQPRLKEGDAAPPLVPFKWIKGAPVTKWETGRLYVVEFGATWCRPCAAAIPHLSTLQSKYKEDVQVISVFVKEQNLQPADHPMPAYVTKVENYVKNKNVQMSYTIAVDVPRKTIENTWLQAASLTGVPHIFVIDGKGKIALIAENIRQAEEELLRLKNNNTTTVTKTQQAKTRTPSDKYDKRKLLLIDDNGGAQGEFLFRSVLTPYDGKPKGESTMFIQSAWWLKPDSLYDFYEDKVEVFGRSLKHLYYIAYADTFSNEVPMRTWWDNYPDTLGQPFKNNSYGKFWHEPLLEVADALPFSTSINSIENRYCYSLKVPKGTGTSKRLQQAMRNDLSTYFGYQVSVETRKMPCWKLSAPDKKKTLALIRSKSQQGIFKKMTTQLPYEFSNAMTADIISMLGANFGYGSYDYGKMPRAQQASFRDETGITDKIDFTFDNRMTFEKMKIHLREMGLELTKSEHPMKVVVIRDRLP